MRAATEGHLLLVMPQGNVVEVLGREVRKGSPGELMVESSFSRQRRPPCRTSKEMSDKAAVAAALTYFLLTPVFGVPQPMLNRLSQSVSPVFAKISFCMSFSAVSI